MCNSVLPLSSTVTTINRFISYTSDVITCVGSSYGWVVVSTSVFFKFYFYNFLESMFLFMFI